MEEPMLNMDIVCVILDTMVRIAKIILGSMCKLFKYIELSQEILEHIYDMGNANAAYAEGDASYACQGHGSTFVVAKYTIEVDI
jgi:hypothetical protein